MVLLVLAASCAPRPGLDKTWPAQDRIIEVGQFTERDAAITVQQMLSAVFYMHKRQAPRCVSVGFPVMEMVMVMK